MIYFNTFITKSHLNTFEQNLYDRYKVIFMEDYEGNDWYAVLKKLNNPTSYKLCLDKNGIVRHYSTDAESLEPIVPQCSLLEIDALPDNFSSRVWKYDSVSDKLIPLPLNKEQIITSNKKLQDKLLQEAQSKMLPLQYKVDLGLNSEEDLDILETYKKYIVDLFDVDVSQEFAAWPTPPNKIKDFIWN